MGMWTRLILRCSRGLTARCNEAHSTGVQTPNRAGSPLTPMGGRRWTPETGPSRTSRRPQIEGYARQIAMPRPDGALKVPSKRIPER